MPFRTLLLEDDENIRQLLSILLAKRGHQVFSFDSPARCPFLDRSICQCEKEEPCFDFLISDNKMPGMTGLEFMEMQDQRGCHLDSRHKALMTGSLRDHEIQAAARLNCQVFEKPINWTRFCHWLAEGESEILVAAR